MQTPKPRVVVTDYTFAGLECEREVIEGAGGLLTALQCRTEEDVIRQASDADGLLVQWAPITRAVIDNLRNCKVIVRYGIGIDNVDLAAARDRGITVCNVPDYCINEVADHTMALALALVRQVTTADRTLRTGQWNPQPGRPTLAPEQMMFATVGFGRTAQAVLNRARGFRFNLAIFDPYLPSSVQVAEDIAVLGWDELLSRADIVSLHVPLSEKTRHLIDDSTLARMKPQALLINTARGGLVDTLALVDALNAGTIAGAGLDVFEVEPIPADHPLLACQNAIVTPHVAWYSEQSMVLLQRMAAEEVMRPLTGQAVRNRVV
jgi:D-3-phosphoglycerate dehydrogenase